MKTGIFKYGPAVFGVFFLGALAGCAPRYGQPVYNADRQISYQPGMDLKKVLDRELDEAKRGVALTVNQNFLNSTYRPLQKWIEAIQEVGNTVNDPDQALASYPLLQVGNSPTQLDRVKDTISDKAEGVFNAAEKNRRLLVAVKYELTIRVKKQDLQFYFVRRPERR